MNTYTKGERRILVLGANGMLGNAVLRLFSNDREYKTYGSVRDRRTVSLLNQLAPLAYIVSDVDVSNGEKLTSIIAEIQPEVIINCCGVIKQAGAANNPLIAIPINAILPHKLARIADVAGARLIHISTDCVFSGERGNYKETDKPDASDLYGLSKLLGEVDYPNAITLRTSIIGHELEGNRGLLCWFLSQKNGVRGFRRAIFSGLPTVEIARVIRRYIIPNRSMHGLYHLSSSPISKYNLLRLVAEIYDTKTNIAADYDFIIDRSLNSDRLRSATGYEPEEWSILIQRMRKFG